MAKFNFNLRDPKNDGDTSVHLVIRWSNNRLVFPTKENIDPIFWETDKSKRTFQRAKETKKFPEYLEFNARLDKIEQEAKNIFRQFQNDNENRQPTVQEYRELLNLHFNKEPKVKNDFLSFIEKFIEDARNRVNDKTGKLFSDSTIQAYKNTLRILREFKEARNKRIDFDTIDLDFYQDFTEYLSRVERFSNNTVGKHIKTVKTFLNEATERGINQNLSYKSKRFRVISEKTESIYLSEKELTELYHLDVSDNPRLERVKDLFLVGCWTGLRFGDFSSIGPENIKGDFIQIETKKTAEKVVIPIHDTVKEIMKKYREKYTNSLPPAISNVKMNKYLKELGCKADSFHTDVTTNITRAGQQVATTKKKYELITTHTARRSFATNLYIDGFPAISIMKITGHRTEKAFMRYIKITPSETAKTLQLHWQSKKQKTLVNAQ